MRSVSLTAVGHASSLFLAATFIIRVAFDLTFPQWAMLEAWRTAPARLGGEGRGP